MENNLVFLDMGHVERKRMHSHNELISTTLRKVNAIVNCIRSSL